MVKRHKLIKLINLELEFVFCFHEKLKYADYSLRINFAINSLMQEYNEFYDLILLNQNIVSFVIKSGQQNTKIFIYDKSEA